MIFTQLASDQFPPCGPLAEDAEKSGAVQGGDEFTNQRSGPGGDGGTFDNVFCDFADVVNIADGTALDDGVLLADEVSPFDSQEVFWDEGDFKQHVPVHVPTAILVGEFQRATAAAHGAKQLGSPQCVQVAAGFQDVGALQTIEVALGEDGVTELADGAAEDAEFFGSEMHDPPIASRAPLQIAGISEGSGSPAVTALAKNFLMAATEETFGAPTRPAGEFAFD
jgi:hypothetical protein